MSSDIAIKVENLSKCYQIYDTPRDRLKQFVYPKIKGALAPVKKLITSHQSPITNYYREFWALKDVSFEVKKGETVGIIGRNGSGKSTLLQMICGTLTPTSGSVQTNGRIAALLELGSGFNPEFTGRENVYMNASILGLSQDEIDARFDDIAAFADIGEFIEQPVKTYSSGMLVRLAFAVSVCVDPEILVVDEALSVGDMVFQQRCLQRLTELCAAGVTILMVSHDIMLIRNYCTRTIYLNGGIVKRIGEAETVGEAYIQDMFAERQSSACKKDSIEWRDTDKGKLAFGSTRGHITSVRAQNAHGRATLFEQGELVTFFMFAEVALDILNPEFIFQLRDARGYIIYGISSTADALQISVNLSHKKVFGSLCVPLNLCSGNYSITTAIVDRHGKTVFTVLDKVIGILDFSIDKHDPQVHGCINLYGKWNTSND